MYEWITFGLVLFSTAELFPVALFPFHSFVSGLEGGHAEVTETQLKLLELNKYHRFYSNTNVGFQRQPICFP